LNITIYIFWHPVGSCTSSAWKFHNISIQWHNSPELGQGFLIVRFLDHAAGLLRWVISSLQSGQATTFCKFLTIPNPPTRVRWQLDQQRHLVAKRRGGGGQKKHGHSILPTECLCTHGVLLNLCHKSMTWDQLLYFPSEGKWV
jgi:hypothetical protein